MTQPKSPLVVVAEFLAANYKLDPYAARHDAESLMDRLVACRLPADQAQFRLNDPATVAQRVTQGCAVMERIGLDPLFIHDVRQLAASVAKLDPAAHQPLIQAVLAHATHQAMCEAEDPPDAVWQHNDQLNIQLDKVLNTYTDQARKDYENERGKQV